MRVAAGVLMIVCAVGVLTFAAGFLTEWFTVFGFEFPPNPLMALLSIFVIVVAVNGGLVLTGGILALKRKFWGFCLASSIIVSWAILPLIFVCARGSEWES